MANDFFQFTPGCIDPRLFMDCELEEDSSLFFFEEENLPLKASMRPHVYAGVGVCAGEGANSWDGNRQWHSYPPSCKIKKRVKDAIRLWFRH